MQAGDLSGVVLSFWAGAATGLGAIAAVVLMDVCTKRDSRGGVHSVLAFSLSLAAGVMISVSVVDLWIPLVLVDGLGFPSLAVLAGVGLFKVLSHLLLKCSPPSLHLLPIANEELFQGKLTLPARERHFKLALTMFLTLTLHNIPEGLAVSVSNTASEKLGGRIAVAIAFHNFPEGVAIAVPYYAATGNRARAIGLAFLSGLSEPVGALCSVLLLGPFFRANPSYMPYSLCVVGGIMLASAVLELLPEAKSHGRMDLLLLGMTVGCITMLLTIWATE
ncbi:hypothetical protein BASA81_002127 [Batrachochytrium salamandrivorans]|nr:hypothetical protein BASA81_002127 [Batrachochytrium salamandrivorans]